MYDLKFNEKEKKELHDSLGLILDDIRSLCDLCEAKKIQLYLTELPKIFNGHMRLRITNEEILIDIYCTSHFDAILEKINKKGKKERPMVDPEVTAYILKNYNVIRQLLQREIENSSKEKDSIKASIQEIKKQYTKDATIELDLPPSQNVHEIEIIEEEGKNVGIINFGNRTIKIFTDGDIVLVDRRQENNNSQIKRKIKWI